VVVQLDSRGIRTLWIQVYFICITVALKNNLELIEEYLYIGIKDLWTLSITLWQHFLYVSSVF